MGERQPPPPLSKRIKIDVKYSFMQFFFTNMSYFCNKRMGTTYEREIQ